MKLIELQMISYLVILEKVVASWNSIGVKQRDVAGPSLTGVG